MKINTLFLLLLIILPFTVSSQVDNLGDLFQQAGEEFNEENALGSQPENNRSQNQNNAPSPEDQERMDRWIEMFGRSMSGVIEGMEHFKTPETRCLFTMVVYADSFMDLEAITDATDDGECQKKYDLYGMQILAITASTTIINCPEGLWDLNMDWFKFMNDVITILSNESNSSFVKAWEEKFNRVVGATPDPLDVHDREDVSTDISNFIHSFHPNQVIEKLFVIHEYMEALGCGG